jgi:hypothetical protein
MTGMGFGILVEDIAPAAIRALDLADLGFDLQVDARVAKGAAAVAIDLRGLGFDGFERLSHNTFPDLEPKCRAARVSPLFMRPRRQDFKVIDR